MRKFNLIHLSGPHGDETSYYEVSFPEEMTVEEFIPAIIEQYPGEWGSIKVSNKYIVDYKRGEWKITNKEFYESIKNNKIRSINSNGGWSNMDYIIQIENNPKPKNIIKDNIIKFPF